MTVQLEFWFEFASTYSYLAASRIEALATSRGVRLVYRPFLLGPIFAAQGWNDSPFNLYPSKGAYMWRDMERSASALGVPFRRPSAFPRSGLLAARVCVAHAEAPWLPAFVTAVYRANFAEDRDISTPEVVSALLAAVGAPVEEVLTRATTAEAKAALRANTEEASARGIFGAPSFCAQGELFWGNDRLEQALAWAMAHAERAPSAEA